MEETAGQPAELQPASNDPIGELTDCQQDLLGLQVAVDDRPRDLDANHRFAHERVERARWLVKYQLAVPGGPLDGSKYGRMLDVFYRARRLENSTYEVYERVYQSYEPRAELPDLPPAEVGEDSSALVNHREAYIDALFEFSRQLTALVGVLRRLGT